MRNQSVASIRCKEKGEATKTPKGDSQKQHVRLWCDSPNSKSKSTK